MNVSVGVCVLLGVEVFDGVGVNVGVADGPTSAVVNVYPYLLEAQLALSATVIVDVISQPADEN